jgi:hypothetical protein
MAVNDYAVVLGGIDGVFEALRIASSSIMVVARSGLGQELSC